MRILPYLLVAAIAGALLPAADEACAQEAESRVQTALESLHRWIGGGEKGDGWRSVLRSDELEQQLALGDDADPAVVREIRDLYAGDTPGLQMRRFAAVRQALDAWLEELPPLSAAELPAAVEAARKRFHSVTDEQLQQARRQLDDAVRDLDRLMAKWVRSNREAWQAYLRWEEMKTQLAAESPDLKVLQAISDGYYQNHEGLELPRFTAVREALRNYVNLTLFASNPKASEFYEKHLGELAKRLESYAAEPKADDAVLIGQIVGWMERFGQADEVVEAVRHHHSRPNLLVHLSEDMLQTGVETDVNERMRVTEVILGTTIRSNARMAGRVGLDLVPSDENAALDLLLTGTTYSNNTGFNGPVKILSTGVTSVRATKRVMVDAEGVTTGRARASANTRSNVYRVLARSHLIEHVAWKKVRQSKSQTEVIASGRAARRVAAQMDREVGELLEPAKETFAERFRNPLLRRGGFPQLLSISTSEDFLFIKGLQAAADQLAAPGEPPALTADHDVAVRVHQSLFGNASQAMLGGVTLTDERMALMAERLTGEVPEELQITPETDPWSITFAAERPVEARFDDNQVEFFVRARQFTRSDQTLRENVAISATYKVEKTPEGSRLTRQGDVNVVFGEDRRLSVGDVAMKTFVRKKFENLFKPEFVSEGVALPGRWEQAGKMRLDQLLCDNGWIALGWYQPAAAPTIARLD